jgi:superfamily I DNA/RNA helicase
MTPAELKECQRTERAACLQAILDSKEPKKLIVAGAGTGKTFTFREVLKPVVGGTNLVMTFIRKLVADMEKSMSDVAEVKTFHAYCKKILHEQNGKVELVAFLTQIVERDAALLGEELTDFDTKFRMLDEGPEIEFYLSRGDYYEFVGFDDSVYRLYKELKSNPAILPEFDQILIDEFQDFNPLEVAFIHEVSKKGNILIVGDDDQAVYDGRSSSPLHLRELAESAEFKRFELPFCSRCPEVIVEATNALIEAAQRNTYFVHRIPKRYECYLEDKEADSERYSKIVVAQCTTAGVVAKYIEKEISAIQAEDISESYKPGSEYPTVLVVGAKQYLREIEKHLKPIYDANLSYSPSPKREYRLIEAYELLLVNERSNLGWRIIAEFFLDENSLTDAIRASTAGTPMIDFLDGGLINSHLGVLDSIRKIGEGAKLSSAETDRLNSLLAESSEEVVNHFAPGAKEEPAKIDTMKPTILLTSLRGCKGLSAGHVFIVGSHDGSLPRDSNDIQDVEIAQFIVALTRTRKRCHIISNRWLVAPVDRQGNFVAPNQPSRFISWIPKAMIDNRGNLKATDFR